MARRKMTREEKIELLGYEETLEEMEARLFGSAVNDICEDDADEMDYACSACGNPDYPKCKWSCRLYDE